MNLKYLKLCTNLSLFLMSVFQQPATIWGFYGKNDGISVLTDKDFDEVILNSPDVWVVEYFAPWCPYCKEFVPEMKKLGRMKKKFKVAAINADKYVKIATQYSIDGYPTVKIFGRNKKVSPTQYDGEWKANSIASAANQLT